MSTPQILSNCSATIALVANHAPWSAARLAAPDALHCALLHQLFEHDRFVALAGGQDKGDRFAAAFGTNMNFGALAALAAAQSFNIGARIVCIGSVLMGAHDRSINIMRFPITLAVGVSRLLQAVPNALPDAFFAPAIKRLAIVEELPYSAGISRQGAAVRLSQSIPFTIGRCGSAGRPVSGFSGGRRGASRSHWASVKSERVTITNSIRNYLGFANTT